MVVREGELLLGRKLKKIGAGKWNGFGGKVETGETIEEAAARECQEEIGLEPTAMRKAGIVLLHYPDKPLGTDEHEIHIFEITAWQGEIAATDEMAEPRWFRWGEIPYGEMWADDRIWLPLLLERKWFEGEFWFSVAGEMVDHTIAVDKIGVSI